MGLVALALVVVVVALVLAIGSTRDPLPDRLRACATGAGAGVVQSAADLGARTPSDIGAGAVRVGRPRRVGDDTAVLLTGPTYRILVLAGQGSPPLSGDLPRRVFDDAARFALVVRELDPVRGALTDCLGVVSGG